MDYLKKIREAVRENHPPAQPPTKADQVTAGPYIEWSLGGEIRRGVVDFVHTDEDGICWLFVAFPDGGWAAVNARYATNIAGGPHRFPDTLAK